ncbi:GM19595 [Drosophila sechellia]|uniref:GM19595 n=1 Tax=Drosophila sechellia TaxID=7238 RepID=B4IM70_DROSE|nr:GM19595 [Drosophila sechellia]
MDSGNDSARPTPSPLAPTVSGLSSLISTTFKPKDIMAFVEHLPTFDGTPRQLDRFITSVEEILMLIRGADQTPYGLLTLRTIRNKIIDRADEALELANTPLVWDEIKSNLIRLYSSKKSEANLLSELNTFSDNLTLGQLFFGISKVRSQLFSILKNSEHNNTVVDAKGLQRARKENSIDVELDSLLQRFWEVENCPGPIVQATKEELDCEAHFVKNYTRLPAGDYSVRLPLKLHLDSLGDSYPQALQRFLSLERKLTKHPGLRVKYAAFMKEYHDLGHMSPVPASEVSSCRYFLPHHCVMKEDSTTTKLRVVFDGSATTSTGYSLNDVLMAGPVIQPKLFHILIRFRSHPVYRRHM